MERRHRTLLVVALLSFATALAVLTMWMVYGKYSGAARARAAASPPAEHATGAAAPVDRPDTAK